MKKLIAVFMAAALVLLLASCYNDSEEKTGKTVKIQFMHMQVEQERVDEIQKIIDKFQMENQGILVEQVPVNEDDYDVKIMTLGASGKLPAVVEYSQEQARMSVSNQFTDTSSVNKVIDSIGINSFYQGALYAVRTENGESFAGVPVSNWVQGIWVNEAMIAEKGFAVPTDWKEVLTIAKAFNDPVSKKYGIAIPTGENTFTEQVFSQFALSNDANVFDQNGKATINTPEMKEALAYYRELAALSMPGSTGVPEVKDAFIGKNTPMAMYSTYILGATVDAGFVKDVRLSLPANKKKAAYGTVICLGISSGLGEEEKNAAKKFVGFYAETENNASWLLMSPGGMHPVIKSVSNYSPYLTNSKIVAYSHLAPDVASAAENLKFFGTVNGKNYAAMGDITNKNIISKLVNSVVVLNGDIDKELEIAQKEVEELVK